MRGTHVAIHPGMVATPRWFAAAWAVLVTVSACSLPNREPRPRSVDYLEDFPTGEAQRHRICARGHADLFAESLCPESGDPPTIHGLDDLKTTAWIDPLGSPFAITAQSTSSVARSTTVLNPRAVFYPAAGSADPYTLVGFARGDGFAEVIAFDPMTNEPNFYFVRYRRACDPDCSLADRFSPDSESGWEEVSVYDDVDLHDTVLDCLMCHQPEGAGTRRFLRMQELEDPWTHWFERGTASEVLLDTFLKAHAGDSYAGIPHDSIEDSNAAGLQFFLFLSGNQGQPNQFPSATVEAEGRGPAWLALHAAAVAGEAISPPHWSVSPFDPAKVADASLRYRGVRSGDLPASETPDLADLFLESAYPDLGFTAATEAVTGADVVRHRCGTCHNGKVPELRRNGFDVRDYPALLTPETKQLVLERLRLPETDARRMPPLIFSELTEEHLRMIEDDLRP